MSSWKVAISITSVGCAEAPPAPGAAPG